MEAVPTPLPEADTIETTGTPIRSKEEITEEYSQCSSQVGDLNYKIAVMKEDAQRFYKRMFELNQEERKRSEAAK